MICEFDDFSNDTAINQIYKSTILLLIKSDISPIRKRKLRRILSYFEGVSDKDINRINWRMKYDKNNSSDELLVNICYLIVNGLVHTNKDGTINLMNIFDEQRMNRLYEKFVLSYYQTEYKDTRITANASRIDWILDDTNVNSLLPVMQSDITLTNGIDILIIDTKYYSEIVQNRFDIDKLRNNNLYQIFTYVKNEDAKYGDDNHKVSGMLLYAKTDELINIDWEYSMIGNKIISKVLNLDADFEEIKKQLNGIVNSYL